MEGRPLWNVAANKEVQWLGFVSVFCQFLHPLVSQISRPSLNLPSTVETESVERTMEDFSQ